MRATIARAAAVMAALAVIGAAWAHGPTRQKVRESIEINAPQEKVWAALANFQDMPQPFDVRIRHPPEAEAVGDIVDGAPKPRKAVGQRAVEIEDGEGVGH